MTVVAILGILAVVAAGAYTRYTRSARKTSVIAELSALSLRERSYLNISGHFASTTDCEDPDCTYPTGSTVTATKGPIQWNIRDEGYTRATASEQAYFRGGPGRHGFDALQYLPHYGHSYCGYAVISGYGSDHPDDGLNDAPPDLPIASRLFPASGAERLRARDWFYAFALCDFDYDGTYSAFTISSYDERVNATSIGAYSEGE